MINEQTLKRVKLVSDRVHEREIELLKLLASIPAPSHHEEARALIIQEWLMSIGAKHVMIDNQKNVLCLLPHDESCVHNPTRKLVVFAAHTDIVFPDLHMLTVKEDATRLYAPGIGDDTANLVALLAATRYLIENPHELQKATEKADILVVANSGEEGLGNLAGTKKLFQSYGKRVCAYYSFDLYLDQCISHAVGSERWKLKVKTQGGHSYHNYGRANAIEIIARAIESLYALPSQLYKDSRADCAKTTVNVGKIQGGTTINSIASEAVAYLEYRCESSTNLKLMREGLHKLVAELNSELIDAHQGSVTLEVVGLRPGNGEVDEDALHELTRISIDAIKQITGDTLDTSAASTDANVPLSLGIPANTIGAVRGALLHTRGEWVDKESLRTGLELVLSLMLSTSKIATAVSKGDKLQ